MIRRHGQAVIIFAMLMVPLIGFLGLAVDGGYYFLATRALSIAADSAARAAAVDVQLAQSTNQPAYYALATADGVQTGQRNLAGLSLTNISFTISYHDSPTPDPNGPGWYAAPLVTTASVRATATGTYNTLFLRAVGVNSVDLWRVGLGSSPAVVRLQRVWPVAVCELDRVLTPAGPWVLWQSSGGNICGLLSWYGLVRLTPGAGCGNYPAWIGPPADGPPPANGTLMTLETASCNAVWPNWQASNGLTAPILVVDTAAGNKVVGCQVVTITAVGALGVDTVLGTPVGGLGTCGPQQTQ